MTIEDSIAYLRRVYPDISKKVTYDVDKKGRDFCEIVLPNQKNENMPVTITVNANGCLLSAGRMINIFGQNEVSAQEIAMAIDDVVNDRIVFVFKYKNQEDFSDRRATESRFFALTGREDDMQEEFDSFVADIEKPVKNKFERFFLKNIGIFEFISFGGKFDRVVER